MNFSEDIFLPELAECIKCLKENKYPLFLLGMFRKSIQNSELPTMLKQGVITLILKPNKDRQINTHRKL